MKFKIHGNTIELFLNKNQENREPICPSFQNKNKVRVLTVGIEDILMLSSDLDIKFLKYSICEAIISRIKVTAKTTELCQIQEITINGNLFFYVDEGDYIGIKYLKKYH